MPRQPRVVPAADGLRARNTGAWAREKLSFLDDFLPPALTATRRKRDRVYVDLFAGPGMNVDRAGGGEFEGGILRAINIEGTGTPRPRFTEAFAVNLSRLDHTALTERIDRAAASGRTNVPRGKIHLLRADANAVASEILQRVNQSAYVLVFADLEAPKQWPWRSVEALHAGGHRSVDLYVLMPLEMGVRRLLPYNDPEGFASTLDPFFGHGRWREVLARFPSSGEEHIRQRTYGLLELYMDGLRRAGWAHVNQTRVIRRAGDAGLYRMLLASNNPAGGRIAQWAADKEVARGQYSLGLEV